MKIILNEAIGEIHRKEMEEFCSWKRKEGWRTIFLFLLPGIVIEVLNQSLVATPLAGARRRATAITFSGIILGWGKYGKDYKGRRQRKFWGKRNLGMKIILKEEIGEIHRKEMQKFCSWETKEGWRNIFLFPLPGIVFEVLNQSLVATPLAGARRRATAITLWWKNTHYYYWFSV